LHEAYFTTIAAAYTRTVRHGANPQTPRQSQREDGRRLNDAPGITRLLIA
jgi:hypothetical protein